MKASIFKFSTWPVIWSPIEIVYRKQVINNTQPIVFHNLNIFLMKTLQSFRENDMMISTQAIKLKIGRMFTLSTGINTWILQI